MNVSIKKRIRDNSPEAIKYLFKSIIRNKLTNNVFFREYAALLEQRENLSEREILDLQFDELKKTLVYAGENVPFYTKTFRECGFDAHKFDRLEQLAVLPIIDKEILRKNFADFQASKPVKNGYYLAFTGGTSGYPLKIHLDYVSIFKELAFVYHQRKRLGYELTDKLATFRGVEFGKKLWLYQPMYNELVFSPFALNAGNVREYLARFDRYAPDFINGYHSAIYHFATLLKEKGWRVRKKIRGLFLASENIDDEKRRFIEDFFDCPSQTFYGHSEKAVFAVEREKNTFEFDSYYGYSEFIADGNSTDSLIVTTGFLNRSMPLIRYNTFDKCALNGDGKFSIVGRWNSDDCLVGFKGEKVSHAAFNFHSDIFENLRDYQFIQNEKGLVKLILQVDEGFTGSKLSKIQAEIAKKVGGVLVFDIKINESFQLSARGKFNRIVKHLPTAAN